MKMLDKFKKLGIFTLLLTSVIFTSCNKDDDTVPEEENEEEVITDVKLIFTNTTDANDIVEARAQDPDGEGVKELEILDTINLDASTSYTLTYEIMNNLESPGEDIGAEIAEEDDEHQLFYSFTNNAFSSPTGDGNIDDATDALNYNDTDDNSNSVGLNTSWTTPSTGLTEGTFTVRLQHQPDVKTSTSGATDGDTDFELTFVLKINASVTAVAVSKAK